MNNKKIGTVLITLGIIIIIIVIVKLLPKKQSYVEYINTELNSEQLQTLIRQMTIYLSESEDINNTKDFSVDEMLSFVFSYAEYFDKDNKITLIDEENSIGIISVEEIIKNVNYIFGINIDINRSTYKVEGGKVYIPLNHQGGDAEIYRYIKTERIANTEQYIAEIACLVPESPKDFTDTIYSSTFDEENVIYTMKIKYKILEGRKVLLGYSIIPNIQY